jgi:hypothetical protein
LQGGDESGVEGMGRAGVGGHARSFEEWIDLSHGRHRFGEDGGRLGEGCFDEADGQSQAAPLRMNDDAADAAQFLVDELGALGGGEIGSVAIM